MISEKQRSLNQLPGFTIIELMVVVAILGVFLSSSFSMVVTSVATRNHHESITEIKGAISQYRAYAMREAANVCMKFNGSTGSFGAIDFDVYEDTGDSCATTGAVMMDLEGTGATVQITTGSGADCLMFTDSGTVVQCSTSAAGARQFFFRKANATSGMHTAIGVTFLGDIVECHDKDGGLSAASACLISMETALNNGESTL